MGAGDALFDHLMLSLTKSAFSNFSVLKLQFNKPQSCEKDIFTGF